jgi:hypothetical protein
MKHLPQSPFTSVADPWHFDVDPDPRSGCMPLTDPDLAIFIIALEDANKKVILKKSFSAYYFPKVHLHHFKRYSKRSKRSQKTSEIKVFLTIFA